MLTSLNFDERSEEINSYLELAANQLLERFGAGSHKPGSGSAAAYQAMLSAKLTSTVIQLSVDRPKCAKWRNEFKKIEADIQERIYPKLAFLFDEDSVKFGIVIKHRRLAKAASDAISQKFHKDEELEALKPATEIPIQIAELGIELVAYATLVFDNGFQAARGDTGVAMHAALSAVAGGLSIANLNLIKFSSNPWTSNIIRQLTKVRHGYNECSIETEGRLKVLEKEVSVKHSFHLNVLNILGSWDQEKSSYQLIEDITKRLQNELWSNKELIWREDAPGKPRDILNPGAILNVLGYQFIEPATLGHHEIQGVTNEIAGFIDKEKMQVSISKNFAPEVRNFTAAHELGHALLHKAHILHRDIALDGSEAPVSRNRTEAQADKFAAYFLMPERQVVEVFQEFFLTDQFEISDDFAFALLRKSATELRDSSGDKRGLARILAGATQFNGKHFKSLAQVFNVSIEAMAIRMEELNLLRFT